MKAFDIRLWSSAMLLLFAATAPTAEPQSNTPPHPVAQPVPRLPTKTDYELEFAKRLTANANSPDNPWPDILELIHPLAPLSYESGKVESVVATTRDRTNNGNRANISKVKIVVLLRWTKWITGNPGETRITCDYDIGSPESSSVDVISTTKYTIHNVPPAVVKVMIWLTQNWQQSIL